MNFSDPFGLCEDPNDPKCKKGGVISLGLSGTAAFAHFGINWEAGLAFNVRTGEALGFAKWGPSMGGAVSLGVEVAIQKGSLSDFEGTDDISKNVMELEGSAGFLGGNVVLDSPANNWKPLGLGFNVGTGAGLAGNLTSNTAVTPTFSLYEKVRQAVNVARDILRAIPLPAVP